MTSYINARVVVPFPTFLPFLLVAEDCRRLSFLDAFETPLMTSPFFYGEVTLSETL